MLVDKETATNEIESWLDYKKVGQKKRESAKESIETLIDAVQEGILVVNEDKTITHKLKFPLEGESSITELIYKPRINSSLVQMHMQGVKSADTLGTYHAYGAALATKPKEVIKKLDTEDLSIVQNIALFFL